MKHKLNLNGPAARIAGLIAVVLAALPLALYFCSLLLGALHLPRGALPYLMRGTVALGLVLLGVFAVLIVVEQMQDAHMDAVYRRGQRRKIPLAGGRYECQYCGNRQLGEADRRCGVCGKELE